MESDDFRRQSRAVWEAMAPGWDARHGYFEEIARPVTERMLERLDPRPGDTILDLAAGTGVAGFAAAELVGSDGKVIVSDFARGMVEAARRHASRLGLRNIECQVQDAEKLDLYDDAVDGVLCRWGYMLMADPARALAETRRVLRSGGRLACAVFSGPAENPWGALPVGVLVERGHLPPPEAGAPGLFALADGDRLRNMLVEAGFAEPRIEHVSFMWGFTGPDDFWLFLQEAAGAITIVLDRLDPEERERVGDEVRRRVASFGGTDEIELPGTSLVVSCS